MIALLNTLKLYNLSHVSAVRIVKEFSIKFGEFINTEPLDMLMTFRPWYHPFTDYHRVTIGMKYFNFDSN